MPVAKLSSTKFKVNLGFLSLESNWEVNEIQKNAAWEMYVELVTRITTSELKSNEGLLREALCSFHSLFKTTREILKKYGPFIATPGNPDDITFGHLAVNILNKVIKPVLSEWHPILLAHENSKPSNISLTEHERKWEDNETLREQIKEVRKKLTEYAEVLGEVAGVANLLK